MNVSGYYKRALGSAVASIRCGTCDGPRVQLRVDGQVRATVCRACDHVDSMPSVQAYRRRHQA